MGGDSSDGIGGYGADLVVSSRKLISSGKLTQQCPLWVISRHVQRTSRCPLSANSGHCAFNRSPRHRVCRGLRARSSPWRGWALSLDPLVLHKLQCKRLSQGRISKAPTNCPTSIISATVTALRGYSVPRVKIIHCCQLGPEAARRHRYIHEVRKILFDLFGSPTGSMAVHVFSLIKKRDLVIDVNQMSAGPSYTPFISMMAPSRDQSSLPQQHTAFAATNGATSDRAV